MQTVDIFNNKVLVANITLVALLIIHLEASLQATGAKLTLEIIRVEKNNN